MRRALAAGLLLAALTTSGCAGTPTAASIEGTDLQSRYPEALRDARRTLARSVALALVLFAGWLAADVARGRGAGGGAFLTGLALVVLFTGGWLVVATAGTYPQGVAYTVAVNAVVWVTPVSVAAGLAWLAHGQAVWGAFLVVLGMAVVPVLYLSSMRLWLCC